MKFTVDKERHEIKVNGREIHFPLMEFKVLAAFSESDGKVLSRSYLSKNIWGIGGASSIKSRTVDQHIARIRRKLGKNRNLIKTISCVGYKITAR